MRSATLLRSSSPTAKLSRVGEIYPGIKTATAALESGALEIDAAKMTSGLGAVAHMLSRALKSCRKGTEVVLVAAVLVKASSLGKPQRILRSGLGKYSCCWESGAGDPAGEDKVVALEDMNHKGIYLSAA